MELVTALHEDDNDHNKARGGKGQQSLKKICYICTNNFKLL